MRAPVPARYQSQACSRALPRRAERPHAARSLLRAGCRSNTFTSRPSTSTNCSISASVFAAVTWMRNPTSGPWDERIGGKRRVDPVVEEEPADGVDVLMTRERHFDDGESRSVRSVHAEPFELVEHGCGLPPEIGANGITAPLVHVEADEDGRERCNRRRAGIEVRWRGGLQQALELRRARQEGGEGASTPSTTPTTSTTLSYVSPV